MSIWKFKAIIQKCISFLPKSDKINYIFQKYITKGVKLTDEYIEDRLTLANEHLKFYKKHRGDNFNIDIIELGTGWYPIIPICLFLSGAKSVSTIDINSLLNEENVKTAIAKIIEYYKEGKIKKYIPDIKEDRLNILLKYNENPCDTKYSVLLNEMNIQSIVTDARKTDFRTKSIDLIISNNTFEHIYPSILKDILIEFKRILKPEGLMIHFIDMSDHFAHMDSSINIYNFLKYSKQRWRLIDNSVQPQNRLRITQYREIYKEVDIKIIDQKHRPGNIKEVESLKIHKDFSDIKISDIAISHSYLVS